MHGLVGALPNTSVKPVNAATFFCVEFEYGYDVLGERRHEFREAVLPIGTNIHKPRNVVTKLILGVRANAINFVIAGLVPNGGQTSVDVFLLRMLFCLAKFNGTLSLCPQLGEILKILPKVPIF